MKTAITGETAHARGLPAIDEYTFLRLLTDVRSGTAHEATAATAAVTTRVVRSAVRMGSPSPGGSGHK